MDMNANFIARRGAQSLQEQVRQLIFEAIRSGELAPGHRLPTEREYAGQLGVSLAPVRGALAQLVASGHLKRRQGKGTFVAEPKVPYALELLSSSTDSLRRAGVEFSTTVVACGVTKPPSDIASHLCLERDAKAIRFQRVIAVRSKPAVLLESWLPARTLVITDAHRYFMGNGSLYRLLKDNGLELHRSQGNLDLARATDAEAGLLSLPFGHPMFEIRALVTGKAGQPIERSRRVSTTPNVSRSL